MISACKNFILDVDALENVEILESMELVFHGGISVKVIVKGKKQCGLNCGFAAIGILGTIRKFVLVVKF